MKKIHIKRILTSLIASVVLVQTFSFSSFAADSNPDLAVLATEYGYDQDTFQFTNHTLDTDLFSDEEYTSEYNRIVDEIMSDEEHTHHARAVYNMGSGGFCYAFTALSVLVHNGVISPNDLQEGAETLHDVTLDHDVERQLYLTAVNQTYHDVDLTNCRNFNVLTKEERVDELLSMAEKCQENNSYYMISYLGITSDGNEFAHAVTGIGMAKGNWMFSDLRNYITYDTCILTYDSNSSEYLGDVDIAGGFKSALCIYINSETKQFCIPGYGITSENSGQISYVTDATNRFTYRSEINGTDTIGEDVSDVAEVLRMNDPSGLKIYTVSENGTKQDITDLYYNNDATVWSNVFYCTSKHLVFEESNAEDYEETSSYDVYEIPTIFEGATWWSNYCIRYNTGNAFYSNCNYVIDVTPTCVSITNKGVPNDDDPHEMNVNERLTRDGNVYYRFSGSAAEGETVTLKEEGDGVILTASDGTLKGNISASPAWQYTYTGVYRYADHDFNLVVQDSCYVEFNKTTLQPEVYLDLDQDGVYESPIETGDADGNGTIDVQDAVTALTCYAKLAAKVIDSDDMYEEGYSIDTLDMNGDGKVDVQDAVEILTTYAKRAAGQDMGTNE